MVENDSTKCSSYYIALSRGWTLKKKKNQCSLPLLHEYNALGLAESVIWKYELVELNHNHVPYMPT